MDSLLVAILIGREMGSDENETSLPEFKDVNDSEVWASEMTGFLWYVSIKLYAVTQRSPMIPEGKRRSRYVSKAIGGAGSD